MKHVSLFLFFILYVSNYLSGQSLQEVHQRCLQAQESGDQVVFLESALLLDELRPNHPTVTHLITRAYLLNNQPEDAVRFLSKLLKMDASLDLNSDSLWQLLPAKSMVQIKNEKELLNEQISKSALAFQLTDKTIHPESVIRLNENSFLISSVRNRKIILYNSNIQETSDWITGVDFFAVLGMALTENGKSLWVVTSAMPEMTGFTQEVEFKSRIFHIDVGSRKVISEFNLDDCVAGDIAIGPGETVYFTDSKQPRIFKYDPVSKQIKLWLDLSAAAYNLQGITLTPDGAHMFVADYIKGLLEIDVKTGKHFWLPHPFDLLLKGIDGLYYHENSLIAIHNGVKPYQIVKYKLDPQHARILGSQVLERGSPFLNEPTLGYRYKNDFYYVANSPWKAYDKEFNFDENAASAPGIYLIDLKKVK